MVVNTLVGLFYYLAVAKRILDAHHATVALSDRPGDDAWYHAELVTVPAAGGNSDPLCTTRKQVAMPRSETMYSSLSTSSNDGVFGAPFLCVHATWVSVTSPDPPMRIAITDGESYPVLM